jgi:putative transposase
MTPHPLYAALGLEAEQRQAAFRELSRLHLDPGMVDQIRAATNGDYVLGSPLFQEEVGAVLGRCLKRASPGRPRKKAAEG